MIRNSTHMVEITEAHVFLWIPFRQIRVVIENRKAITLQILKIFSPFIKAWNRIWYYGNHDKCVAFCSGKQHDSYVYPENEQWDQVYNDHTISYSIWYLSFSDWKYRNCTGNPCICFYFFYYHETTISEKERQKMIIFLALVLIILMILIGGERGAVSLMTLAGNIVILFISILLISI